jgi:hypothetical protein
MTPNYIGKNVQLESMLGHPCMQFANLSARPGTTNDSSRSCIRLRVLEAAVVSAANAAHVARTAFKASSASAQLKTELDAANAAECKSVHEFYEHTWMHGCTD